MVAFRRWEWHLKYSVFNFMKTSGALSTCLGLFMILCFMGSCKPGVKTTGAPMAEGAFKIKVVKSSGDTWLNRSYLGLPGNLGMVISPVDSHTLALVLSKHLPKGSTHQVLPIGVMRYQELGVAKQLVISIPTDTSLQTLVSDDIQRFNIEHHGPKWIIEQYITNQLGFGKVQIVGWEPKNYFYQQLLLTKE